jgi:hypothetical protein
MAGNYNFKEETGDMQFDAQGNLKVNIQAGAGSGGTASTDDSAFTAASGSGTPMMGFVTADSVDSGDVGVVGMLANRQLKVTLYDSAGAELAVGGGTQYTEDAASAANPTGTVPMLIRQDTPASEVSANGDNIAQRATAYGAAYTQIVSSTGSFIDSFGGGTQYTEDAAAAANPVGTAPILVRQDTPSALVSTDGDNVAQRATNYGAAYVQIVSSSGAFVDSFGGGTQYTEGDTDATITGTAMLMEGAANTLVPAQGTAADGLLVNLGANNDVTVTGTVTANLAAGTNNIGDVDVLTVPAPLSTTGGGTEATALRVTIANDSTGVVSVDDNGASLTVDGTVAATQSGTWNINNVSGTVSLPTGASTLAEQQTQTTSLQLLDDAVVTLGTDTYTEAASKAYTIGAVRRDADTTLVNTTNEWGPLQMDANGRLKVEVFSGEALPVSQSGTWVLGANSGVDIGDVTINNASGASAVNIQDGGNSITVDGSVSISGTVTVDSELPTAAALADNTANPTVPAVGSFIMGFDGTTWDRVRADGGSVFIQDGGNSITVDYATTGSGTSTGALRVELPTNGTGVVGLNTGSNTIGSIASITTSVVPGTAATNLGKAVDSGAGATDTGVASLVIRDDALTTLTPVDGDYVNERANARGATWVAIEDGAGGQITSFGGGTQYTEDAAAAANPVGTAPILVRQDTPATLVSADGDNVAQRATNYGAAYVQVVSSSGAFVDTFGGGTQYTEDVAAAADPVGNAQILVRADTPATVTSADGDNIARRGTNYGAAFTQIVTSTGSFVDTFGGGTQYTEGDTDATITGTAMMMEGAGNALVAAQGTAADGLLVNLGANNDVTVTGTVAATQSGTWILGANSGVDIGDVTINNASGASAVNIQDGGNSITVDGSVSISGTVTVAGAKTNNNAAPGATNVGTLPGVANAALQSWTEGNQVALSTDLLGQARVTIPDQVVTSTNITTTNLNLFSGVATTNSTTTATSVSGLGGGTFQVTGTYAGFLVPQATVDGSNWVTVTSIDQVGSNNSLTALTSGQTGIFQIDVSGFAQWRVTAAAFSSGTAAVTLESSHSTGVVQVADGIKLDPTTAPSVAKTNNNTEASVVDRDLRVLMEQMLDEFRAFNATMGVSNVSIQNTRRELDGSGREIVSILANPELIKVQTTTISASVAETTIINGALGVNNRLLALIISNTSTSTNTRIDVRDSTGGPVLFALQSIGGGPPVGFSLGGVAIPQRGRNGDNWTVTCGTSTTDIYVTAIYTTN